MSDGYHWRFDTDRADGGIIVDNIEADMPEINPGAKFDLAMEFWPGHTGFGDYIEGGTAGGDLGFTAGGDLGAVMGSNIDISDHISRYKAVREYGKYVGRVAVNKALDHSVHPTEQLPTNADVDSIIVRLKPGPSMPNTPGLWVLLMDYDDETERIPNQARLNFSVQMLAVGSEYADRAALKADL